MKDWFSNIKKYLKEKNRFIIQNPKTFEQKFALTISKRNTILIVSAIVLIFSFIVYLVISYTSIKNFIPGYPSKGSELFRLDKENQANITKIHEQNKARELWINNLRSILNEEDSIFFTDIKDTLLKDSNFDYKKVVFERIKEDSILRKKVELQGENRILYNLLSESMEFDLPLNKDFKTVEKEETKYIKFSTKSKSKIKASLDGKVINTSPYSVVLHHRNNILTVYENIEGINLEVGEILEKGKTLGTTTDSVFFFQLWYNGESVSGDFIKNLD